MPDVYSSSMYICQARALHGTAYPFIHSIFMRKIQMDSKAKEEEDDKEKEK